MTSVMECARYRLGEQKERRKMRLNGLMGSFGTNTEKLIRAREPVYNSLRYGGKCDMLGK